MTYVHGHAREDGWVVGHVRRPNRPEGEQLPLLTAEAADAAEDLSGRDAADGPPPPTGSVPAPRPAR